MRTLTAVAPFLLVLFGIAQGFPNFPSQLDGGTSLQNRIKSASKDLGVPEWKMWDIWWQLRSCKYLFFLQMFQYTKVGCYFPKHFSQFLLVFALSHGSTLILDFFTG